MSMCFNHTTVSEHILIVFVEILRAAIIIKYLPAINVQSIQLSAFPLQPRFNNKATTVLNSTVLGLYKKVDSILSAYICCFYEDSVAFIHLF